MGMGPPIIGTMSESGVTMAIMATLADRILDAIGYEPLGDDLLARRLNVRHRQAVNQAARRLETQGRLRRFTGPDGKSSMHCRTAPGSRLLNPLIRR